MALIDPDLREALERGLAERLSEMATSAEIAPPPPTDADPLTIVFVEPRDRLAEAAQYLRNLGYISETVAKAAVAGNGSAMAEGYRTFAAEGWRWLAEDTGRKVDAGLPEALDRGARTTGVNEAIQLDPLLLELLRLVTSLDGEFDIGGGLENRPDGLLARIAQFRLKSFGFYEAGIDGIHSDEMGRGVIACANILQSIFAGTSVNPRERLLDRIGDVSGLLRDCADQGKLHAAPILVFDLQVTFKGLEQRKVRRTLFGGEPREGFRMEPFGPPIWFEEDGTSLDLTRPVEEFAQYLVQNALWATGHYTDRLDGFIGNVSMAALREAIGDNEIGRRGPVSAAGRNFVAIWLPELADIILAPSAPVTGDEVMIRNVMAGRAEAGPQRGMAFLGGLFDGIKRLFEEAVEFGRSVMVGAGKLLRRVGNAIARGVRAVVEVIESLAGHIKNLALLIYRGAREAVLALGRVLAPIRHLLFGHPVISRREDGEAYAVTRFQVDRDGKQWFAGGATRSEIAGHSALCTRLSRTFTATVRLAILFAKIAITGVSGPPGWIVGSLSFAGIVSDLVSPGE
ncbi:MAG: hypothetical protein AAF414_18110 [Pseudomonadota bacterium]